MVYLLAALKSILSVVALFLLTKLIGRRQVSQLSLFDYVNGISFGSIAAEIAISKTYEDVFVGLVAMAVYTVVAIAFDAVSNRSIVLRRFLEGVPLVLVEDGKIYEKNFARARIDLNEFLMSCRGEGYFDLSEVQVAIFEPNGKISILPTSAAAQVEKKDLNIAAPRASVPAVVVIDGKIMEKNVKNIGYDKNYIEKQLAERKIAQKDVFFASCTREGKIDVYVKSEEMPKEKLE